MADVIREFLVSLGYKVDPNSEKRFEASVRSATLQADLLGRAIAKSAEKVFEGVQQISKSFEQVYWQAQRAQSTVQGIRAIGYAASQLGSSAENAGASIENFGKQLRWNPGFEGFLKQIGVATRDSKGLRASTDILVDFANKIKGRPKAEQLGLAEVAGIDLATLEAIQSGTFQKRLDEYNAKVKAQGLNSEEAAKRGAEFTQAMKSLGASLEIVGQKLMSEFAPALQRFVVVFDKWTNENGKSFVEVVEKIGETLGQLAGIAEKAATALKPIWEGFDDFSKKLTGQNGLTLAIETLIGLKLAGWLLSVAAGIVAVGNAASAATIGGALTRFFGLLGIAGAGYGGLAYGGYKLYESDKDFNDRRKAIENPGGRNPFAAIDEKDAKEKAAKEKANPSLWERTKRFFGFGEKEPASPGVNPTGSGGRPNAHFTKENADALRSAATELGVSPEDLATVISYETGGQFDPSIRGGAGGRHIGLIQFGPREQNDHRASQDQTFPEQMKSVVDYLKKRGFKPGMSLLDLYSTINAGRPGLHNRSDASNGGAPGTVADKVGTMGPHAARARLFLGSGGAKNTQASTGDDAADYKRATGRDLAKDLASNPFIREWAEKMIGRKLSTPPKADNDDVRGRENPPAPVVNIDAAALNRASENAAKVSGGTGAAPAATLTPSIASKGDTTVTINQNNKVEVVGSGDPSLTASQVGDAQRGLGQVLLRDVKGAVR